MARLSKGEKANIRLHVSVVPPQREAGVSLKKEMNDEYS